MNDNEIVGLFFERNENAIIEAQREYGRYCMYILQNVLNDSRDSEECMNDVLNAAWQSIPPQKPENLKTYLGRLARVISVDRLRKKNAQKRIPEDIIASIEELEEVFGASDVESAAEESELSCRISDFLRTCRKDERYIFIRRYWYYDTIGDICAKSGFTKSKVLVTLKRTRDKLAEYLKKEGYLI